MKSLFLFVIFSSFFESDTLSICSCEENESLEIEIKASDLVLSGEIIGKGVVSKIKRDEKGKRQKIYLIRYEIKVDRAFKGVKKDKKIVLFTTKAEESCGLNLETNQKYIIFAQRGTYLPNSLEFFLDDFEKQSFWGNSCSRTEPYNDESMKAIVQEMN